MLEYLWHLSFDFLVFHDFWNLRFCFLYISGPIGGSLEANPGPEVETESDLKGQGQRNGVEGQGRGIEDLGQRIENAQDLKTERIEKIEKGHAQETEKDHGTEIGIDGGKTKGQGHKIIY